MLANMFIESQTKFIGEEEAAHAIYADFSEMIDERSKNLQFVATEFADMCEERSRNLPFSRMSKDVVDGANETQTALLQATSADVQENDSGGFDLCGDHVFCMHAVKQTTDTIAVSYGKEERDL